MVAFLKEGGGGKEGMKLPQEKEEEGGMEKLIIL